MILKNKLPSKVPPIRKAVALCLSSKLENWTSLSKKFIGILLHVLLDLLIKDEHSKNFPFFQSLLKAFQSKGIRIFSIFDWK